jgi:hypothetical protein
MENPVNDDSWTDSASSGNFNSQTLLQARKW